VARSGRRGGVKVWKACAQHVESVQAGLLVGCFEGSWSAARVVGRDAASCLAIAPDLKSDCRRFHLRRSNAHWPPKNEKA
jgi:hypothetical protein